jgi:hypothetical protein
MIGQRDTRWASQLLGHGTGTIGQYGCVITSVCDGLNEAGYTDETPSTVNNKLKNVPGAFIGTTKNLLDWNKLKEVFTIDYKGSYNYDTVPAPIDKLREYLDQGLVVILRVSAKNIGGTGDHFVRAKSVQGSTVIVRDPWYAEEAPITKRYTSGSIDTAQEIILGFRVMSITKKQGENMQEDEMIVKKQVFTDLVNNSNQRDTIFDAFKVDRKTGTAQQVVEIYTKLKEDRDNLDNALKKAQEDVKEWKGLYETEKITSDERKKKYDSFLEYVCNKLGSIVDAEVVKGKIDELLRVEGELDTAKRVMEDMKIAHAKEKKDLQQEVADLTEKVRLQKLQIDKLEVDLKTLSDKIDNSKEEEVKNNKLQDIIAGILLFFEKLGANRRNTQAKKESEDEKTKS